jgi:hypothetical protein
MNKYPLIGVSICAVVLLVLTSLTNVVGYQTVQSSNQNIISEEVNQRELLFQTICDIANNKEIQRVILKSQINREQFPVSNIPVLTKDQLKQMYLIGLMLSKFISKSRMQSVFGKYQFDNQEMQKEINAVIEKDTILNREITQLSNSECDCENENTAIWPFPILCTILKGLLVLGMIILVFTFQVPIKILFCIGLYIMAIATVFGTIFNCPWYYIATKPNIIPK